VVSTPSPSRSPLAHVGRLAVYWFAILTCACRDGTGSQVAVPNDSGTGVVPLPELAVWASPYSARLGDSVDVYVHSLGSPVSLALYRLGLYGGEDSVLVAHLESVAADSQRSCTAPIPGPVRCFWRRTVRLPTSTSWIGGLYLLKAADQQGRVAYYPFVEKDGRHATFVVVVPQLTWQAYNDFGGSSLYTRDPTSESSVGRYVSFERPYAAAIVRGGLATILPQLRWLEQSGRDITYMSDADLDTNVDSALGWARVVIFASHDEYWTWGMRNRVEALRDRGTHLVFLAANNAYWHIRLAPGRVTGRPANEITCWKNPGDPGAISPESVTTRFRDPPLNRPENALYGIEYVAVSGPGPAPAIVADSGVGVQASSFLQAAGLAAGDTIHGIVGNEGDQIVANGSTPPGLQVLFRSPYSPLPGQAPAVYHTTFYIAPSGAGVFASGLNRLGIGLEPGPSSWRNPALQRVMAAVLDWMASH
jgi:hypothetical protein